MREISIRVIEVADEAGIAAAFDIRRLVFIDEQGVPEHIEMDADDRRALHVLAIAGEQAVGCARMIPYGGWVKIGRMAVKPQWRRRGAGRALLDALVSRARMLGAARAVLNAQVHAEGFYLKSGFRPVGAVFSEAGIIHRRMELEL
jgi:predicted GNAT family N-acyltransferase